MESMIVKKEEMHRQILDEIHELYKRKQHDYGDSFSKTFKKYGAVPVLSRMSEKLDRLDNIILNNLNNVVEDESLSDSLLDLANYAIMLHIEIELEKDKDNAKEEETEQIYIRF